LRRFSASIVLKNTSAPLILGIGGTGRPFSTSEKALRHALAVAQSLGCRTAIVAGPDLPAEHYDPGRPERSEKAAALVRMMRQADGLIVASPGYHGSISGLMKNALDYAEDLRTDSRVYFDGLAIGCIAAADGPQALGSTIAALRSIAHALRAWPTPYAAMINAGARPFGEDGQTIDPSVAAALEITAGQVAEFAFMRQAWRQRAAAHEPGAAAA
jgi:FMN reductase